MSHFASLIRSKAGRGKPTYQEWYCVECQKAPFGVVTIIDRDWPYGRSAIYTGRGKCHSHGIINRPVGGSWVDETDGEE